MSNRALSHGLKDEVGEISSSRGILMGFKPFLRLAFCFILRHSVLLLQTPNESVPRSGDVVQIIVSELAPFLFGRAFELHPLCTDFVPIHKHTPFVCSQRFS